MPRPLTGTIPRVSRGSSGVPPSSSTPRRRRSTSRSWTRVSSRVRTTSTSRPPGLASRQGSRESSSNCNGTTHFAPRVCEPFCRWASIPGCPTSWRGRPPTRSTPSTIRIRSGGTAQIPGYVSDIFPLNSRETFLSDMLLPPSAWSDGGLREQEPLSDSEDFEFPPPVGVQRTFLVSHEEVKTLPRYLGKPVRRVDFKQAFHPELIQAVLSLKILGLLAEDRKITIGLARVPFRRAFLQALPEPSALVHPIGGAKALSVEAEWTAGGTRTVERREIVMA